MADVDILHLKTWVGRQVEVTERISGTPASLMAATLDRDAVFIEGDPLPPAWHWLYFHETTKSSQLGSDGHAMRGGFMPPVTLPRRMWAGGRLRFTATLRVGDVAVRRSIIKSVQEKKGRSGALVFVVVAHEIKVKNHLCVAEEQDIVYREAPRPGEGLQGRAAPSGSQWSETVEPNPLLLFRYSALTFNAHRIHYDKEYCRNQEGYPGLVVHGPLVATLLLDLVARCAPGDPVRAFDYRAVSPLFDGAPFTLHGRRNGSEGKAWAANGEGQLAMLADVKFDE